MTYIFWKGEIVTLLFVLQLLQRLRARQLWRTESGYRARPPGGINTQSHIQSCSDWELLTDGRRENVLYFCNDLKRGEGKRGERTGVSVEC